MCLRPAQFLNYYVDTDERRQLENQQQVGIFFCYAWYQLLLCSMCSQLTCICPVGFMVRMLMCFFLFQNIKHILQSLDKQLMTLCERQKHLECRDNELRQQKKELLERGSRRKQLESKIAVKYDR